jgi:hypothetical protein
MWVRIDTRSGNGLAPVQVFHAVPSSSFSAPAELAGLRPGHLKARCVFPSEENLLASRLRSPSPSGRGTMPAPPLHTAFLMTWPSPIHPGSLEGRPICSQEQVGRGFQGGMPLWSQDGSPRRGGRERSERWKGSSPPKRFREG